jgi:mannose-1-phosphate guanylyltransferase/mannose-6-phosphate isomerase
MNMIYPVLLAGGSGSRLWPLSRKSYPKQFGKLISDKTLFQETALRLTSSDLIQFGSPLILTNTDFRFIVNEQLQEMDINNSTILIEPEAKNTAAAILAACIFLYSYDSEAVLLVSPTDHVITDKEKFHRSISIGCSQLQNNKIITFGIKPTHPSTAYGYIETSTTNNNYCKVSDVIGFIEKPNDVKAKKILETNKFLWNAGIFLFKAIDLIENFKVHAPKTLDLVSQAINNLEKDLNFLRLDSQPWSNLQDISIDYAIMEKIQNLVTVPLASDWSDLGDWNSVWSASKKDLLGNSTSKSGNTLDCSNTLLRSENPNQQIVGIGLENIIAVAMPDAVLVASSDKAQDVKKAVNLLKSKQIHQATIFPKDFRPWGWFESLTQGSNFQVKKIFVKPGAALSLQSHQHRSEHWVVVEGKAKITINKDEKLISEGKSAFVPVGAVHRLENPGKSPLIIIETQIGSYLGEDDIVRYDDIYAR